MGSYQRKDDQTGSNVIVETRLGGKTLYELELAPVPNSVRLARRLVECVLAELRMTRLIEDAALIMSELVTNAIRCGGPVVVRVRADGDDLVLQVEDDSRELPRIEDADPWGEQGRGLVIVDACAAEWGTRPTPRGKVVWARMPLALDFA